MVVVELDLPEEAHASLANGIGFVISMDFNSVDEKTFTDYKTWLGKSLKSEGK